MEFFSSFRKELFHRNKLYLSTANPKVVNNKLTVFIGMYDVLMIHVDAVVVLIEHGMYDALNAQCRSMLDAMLTYQGHIFASDPVDYLDKVMGGDEYKSCKSIAGANLSSTHIAYLSSFITPKMDKLWKDLCSEVHLDVEVYINRMAFHGGSTANDFANKLYRTKVGQSRRPFDEKSSYMCVRALHLAMSFWSLETPLNQNQIDLVRKEISQKRRRR